MWAAEQSLDTWQRRVQHDKKVDRVHTYAFPELVKYLIIEQQEYLNTLQRVCLVIKPSTKGINIRTHATEKPDKERKIATFSQLGFDS
jgi:hypothetical protein